MELARWEMLRDYIWVRVLERLPTALMEVPPKALRMFPLELERQVERYFLVVVSVIMFSKLAR